MANVMAQIENVMIEWRAFRLNNKQAYERISELILQYQKDTWNENH